MRVRILPRKIRRVMIGRRGRLRGCAIWRRVTRRLWRRRNAGLLIGRGLLRGLSGSRPIRGRWCAFLQLLVVRLSVVVLRVGLGRIGRMSRMSHHARMGRTRMAIHARWVSRSHWSVSGSPRLVLVVSTLATIARGRIRGQQRVQRRRRFGVTARMTSRIVCLNNKNIYYYQILEHIFPRTKIFEK